MFNGNIIKLTIGNNDFRRVIYTGPESQLVLMNISANEDIGMEVHHGVDQILFIVSGTCEATVGGKIFAVHEGDVVYVPAGTEHNFKNTGTEDLKLYSIYSPPEHPDGTVDITKPARRGTKEWYQSYW
jgi:mannose-6-phosphate isomerase-like protein (cupin superfamily)